MLLFKITKMLDHWQKLKKHIILYTHNIYGEVQIKKVPKFEDDLRKWIILNIKIVVISSKTLKQIDKV